MTDTAGPEEKMCKHCGKQIPLERLKYIPSALSCAPCKEKHGDDAMPVGRMIYDHKTGGTMQVLTPDQWSHMNDIDRRGVYKGGNKHKVKDNKRTK